MKDQASSYENTSESSQNNKADATTPNNDKDKTNKTQPEQRNHKISPSTQNKELNRETTQQSKDNEQQSDVAEKAPVEALNNDQQSNSSQKDAKDKQLKVNDLKRMIKRQTILHLVTKMINLKRIKYVNAQCGCNT